MSKLAKALTAAAGNAGGDKLYVEDVFSTYLYAGNGADQTITNGIDLDGEGGLVWCKPRTVANPHYLADTVRGVNKFLESNASNAEDTSSTSGGNTGDVNAFNSNGFSVGSTGRVNQFGQNFASWTFRKAEKFFDIVTYSGNDTLRTIPHNLGSTPAVIIIKKTSGAQSWVVYHQSLGATKSIYLEQTAGENSNGSTFFNSTPPTSTEFTVSGFSWVNGSGDDFVAYLFASDAGGFGDDGSESIIKCGSYTADGSGNASITLGFEPQWVMTKRTDSAGSWEIADSMRGLYGDGVATNSINLSPNLSNSEGSNTLRATATGFTDNNAALPSSSHIYIAIRRPMKTPESGAEVFAIDTLGGTAPNPPGFNGLLVDLAWKRVKNTGDDWYSQSRLTGLSELKLNATDAESTADTSIKFDYQDGWLDSNGTLSTQLSWMFKRATGFFDVVAYTGTGVAGRTVAHNLGVAPELMIVKRRDTAANWQTYHAAIGATGYLTLDTTNAATTSSSRWNDTEPTSTEFTLAASGGVNNSGGTFVAYLFATLAGVSKVGSYTGTGADLNVDCGFSAGARFILIKRTDSTGDWYVWDSERGIVAGNDPYLLLNSTAAEVTSTDYIDPLASGFTVTSSAPAALNASGGTYIFMAIS